LSLISVLEFIQALDLFV